MARRCQSVLQLAYILLRTGSSGLNHNGNYKLTQILLLLLLLAIIAIYGDGIVSFVFMMQTTPLDDVVMGLHDSREL